MDNTKIIGENPYAASWSLSCTLDHNKYMFVLFLQYDLPVWTPARMEANLYELWTATGEKLLEIKWITSQSRVQEVYSKQPVLVLTCASVLDDFHLLFLQDVPSTNNVCVPI